MAADAAHPQSNAEALFRERETANFVSTDKLFVRLLLVQWLFGIALAFWVSPRTWVGGESSVHVHVWAAVLLGGLVSGFPIAVATRYPGSAFSRHAIAVGQTLTSALLIHLTGGRIETHFHVFGSLAFLAFYRDWKVLVTASAVVAVDHFVRGVFWPQSVFGVLASSHWRWLEHAGWVVFEDVFLIRSCLRSRREMRELAARQASLEATNEVIEETVRVRTSELRASTAKLEREMQDRERAQLALAASEARTRAIVETAVDGIVTIDERGTVLDFNRAAEEIFGYPAVEVVGGSVSKLLPVPHASEHDGHLRRYLETGESTVLGGRREVVGRRRSGERFPVDLGVREVRVGGERLFTGVVRDITERKRAERSLQAQSRQHAAVAALGREALKG
ncbi:MAG TPA: PAS domain S-box protein, partial [Planctomycetota bacterium]|nr:PAS domain S-box protein [Planctomycetota bacterium]